MTKTYRLLYRPASFCTLPDGLQWEYVEAPASIADRRPDLPRSAHPFGVIRCRELTADELTAFEIEPVGE
jgi:hypothetical protein